MTSTPLIVTRDDVLLEELLRLCAAAGVVPEVAVDAHAALRSWSGPPLVLLGSDVVADLAALTPQRRDGVHVVASADAAPDLLRLALRLGAETVAELPRAEAQVIEALSDLGERAPALTVGVVAGSGGAGASTFACALAQLAAVAGPTVLIDLDPWGAGLDRLLGCESDPGARWQDLGHTEGRLGARALREALPGRGGLGVLTWAPDETVSLPSVGAREAFAAAQRGHRTMVIDLPRLQDPIVEDVVARCDHLFVVVHASLTGVAAAGRVCGRWGRAGATSLVVRRPGLGVAEVSEVLGLPVSAELGTQRGLAEAVDLGVGPIRSRRGPLARAATAALRVAAVA
ncbi:Septum site determining protein [metagenome]|uniref:Septum site determining protein n=1 Tax=metagenome TaxID=256318 RepID=A0A2P2CF23_9ZZZZ